MMKLKLSLITIMVLCTMTNISSTSKDHVVVENKNTQNIEELLGHDPNQSQYEQGLQNQQDPFEKVGIKSSKYIGVSWRKEKKQWAAQLTRNNKNYSGGLFNDEKQAAMKVNLLCDKYKMKRKNPMIIIEPDAIQQPHIQTSQYYGVCWTKDKQGRNKWQTQLVHKKKDILWRIF